MIARAMRTARTVSSASGGDDKKLKLIAGGNYLRVFRAAVG